MVYYEKDILRMQVREDVIEILPNLAVLSNYVDDSNFFTHGEKIQIIKELVQFNQSLTLNKILQFDFSY